MDVKYMSRVGVVAVAVGLSVAACGGSETPSQPPQQSQQSTSNGSSASGGPTTSSSASKQQGSVSKDRAGQIATDRYGGSVLNVEDDHAKGRATWEVEIKNSEQGRIEVEVVKDNGDIVAMEHED